MVTQKNPKFIQFKPIIKHTDELQHLLNESATADFLGVTIGTLQVWRCTKRYNLPYIKVGRLVKYRYSDLMAFLDSRTQNRVGE